MRPGTPGFIGERLTEARQARGLTAIALADLVGVSRQAISQYENGSQSPSPDVMENISRILRIPQKYFCSMINRKKERTIFYRSMAAITKAARMRAGNRYNWFRDIVDYFKEFVLFPKLNIPDLNTPTDPCLLSSEQIEEIAAFIRAAWNISDGPINNMVRLLENNGIYVARDELGAETLDAFSEYDLEDGSAYIVLGSDKASSCRSRFDAAHELGHLILHQKVLGTMIMRPVDHKFLEAQAHRFAGAFLFPGSSFADELYATNLDVFRGLKLKWKVSIGMMIKRAANMEIISPEQESLLWRNYARRGWKSGEPLDREIEIEKPVLLLKALGLIIKSGIHVREDILSRLSLNPHDIDILASLEGRLGDMLINDPEIHFIGDKASQEQGNDLQGQRLARIIEFPVKIK